MKKVSKKFSTLACVVRWEQLRIENSSLPAMHDAFLGETLDMFISPTTTTPTKPKSKKATPPANTTSSQTPSTTTSSPSLPSTSPQTLTILNGIAPFSFNLPVLRAATPPQAELMSTSTKPLHTSPSVCNTAIEPLPINEVVTTTTTTTSTTTSMQAPIESIKKED